MGKVPESFKCLIQQQKEDIVGLEKQKLTGSLRLAAYNLDSVEINYCPMYNRKLGG